MPDDAARPGPSGPPRRRAERSSTRGGLGLFLARFLGLLRSGWVPAALVIGLAIVLAHAGAHVPVGDIARFLGYLAGWIVLPGTLCWRWVSARRGPRPLSEDLAVGALVGYVLEFPVYLLGLALGAPRLYLLWPLVILVATLSHRRGRALWRRTRQPMPLAWSWSVAGLLGYLVVWFGHYLWGPFSISAHDLQRPYVDEPYHLSLVASLKHTFPPDVLYVDDTPLKYHWLSHLHVAASSWVTGIEPVVILRAFFMPALMLLVALALAHIAARLSGARWTGIAAVAALAIAPVDFTNWSDGAGEMLLGARLWLSPSAGFVNAALLLGLFLCVEILRGRLGGFAAWGLTALTLVAMLGAKSTSLPILMAGLVAAAVIGSIAARRLDRRALGLAVLSVVCFVVATPFFFGTGSHGLSIDPFALTSNYGEYGKPAAVLGAAIYLGYLSTAAGLVALLTRRGWRMPDNVFLVVTCLAGFGAGLTFHQASLSEYYFVYVTFLPLILGGALGLQRVAAQLPGRTAVRVGAAALAAGSAAGLVLIAVDHPLAPAGPGGFTVHQVLVSKVTPMAVVAAIVALISAALVLLLRRRRDRVLPGLVGTVVILTIAGMGLAPTLHRSPDYVRNPWGRNANVIPTPLISPGGIAAARWLRDHSDPGDLVATNVHCQFIAVGSCIPRSFWMAAYAERQFLVEGWSYVAWETVGLESPENYNPTQGPFWDPERLADNDAAFKTPTAETVRRLKAYGVRWLFVHRRAPVDIAALRGFADVRFHSGPYTVLELR